MRTSNTHDIWFAAGVRTPFAKVDGLLSKFDAISLSVPVVRHMVDQLRSHARLRNLGHGRAEPDMEQHRT